MTERIEVASRAHYDVEALTLPDDSFKGECRHCEGVVLIPREPGAFMLEPEGAFCVFCGQRYHVSGRMITLELSIR